MNEASKRKKKPAVKKKAVSVADITSAISAGKFSSEDLDAIVLAVNDVSLKARQATQK